MYRNHIALGEHETLKTVDQIVGAALKALHDRIGKRCNA
jgi:hypothetical protein